MQRIRTFLTPLLLSLSMTAADAAAETKRPRATSRVATASLVQPVTPANRQPVAFSKTVAHVGDQVEQTLAMEMRINTTHRQGNQIGASSRNTARNEQRRVLTTTHVEGDRAVAVRVRYVVATKQLSATDGGAPAGQPNDAPETAQPVAGKTYLCQRLPGSSGKLEITDQAGNIPPTDEYEIVAQHMEMVGRENPLAEFLDGQVISAGQSVELPKEIASKVFNLSDQFGEITRFTLSLEGLESRDRESLATFRAHVEATSSNASQMRLELDGLLVVDPATCHVVKVALTGPIAMSEMRGSYSTSYQVIGTGQLKMSAASKYRHAAR